MTRRGGYAAMQVVLALPNRPTAVIVDNNLAGLGSLRALLDAGLRPGRDISVVVYDGIPEDSLLGVRVTAVEQPTPYRVGQALASQILAVIAGKPVQDLQQLWQPELCLGQTDGPPHLA